MAIDKKRFNDLTVQEDRNSASGAQKSSTEHRASPALVNYPDLPSLDPASMWRQFSRNQLLLLLLTTQRQKVAIS